MSEFNRFGAAEQLSTDPVEESESSGSRKKVVALGALAAVVLGAGAFLFLGGSDDEFEEFVPVARGPRAEAPVATPTPAAKLPAASKITLGRNPFRALYVQPPAGGAPAAGAATTGTTPTTPTTGTTPVVVGSGSTPTGGTTYVPPTTTSPAPAPAPAAQSTVSLKQVVAGKNGANPTATFVYDGQEVSGAPGDVMAGKLLVISLQQDHTGSWFANLQLGDGSPFEVHERQTVVVQ
ncbi:MAG: hypothetical protein WD794_06010 [Mycobacteriales bacterium]